MLKADWITKKLGDCFRLKSGENLTKDKMSLNGIYPVFGGNGLAGFHDDFNLSGSNVIIGRVGALCGNVRHVADKIWLTDNCFKVVDAKYDFNHSFLTYLLTSKNLGSFSRQSAQPVISNSSLQDVVLEFPTSIIEQTRIVAILDEAFANISQAVANAEKNLANARELFDSYLNEVFTRKGEGWEEKYLSDGELLKIIDGDRGSNYPTASEFFPEEYCLFLSTKNVRPDGFKFNETMFITKEKDQALRKGKLQRLDVVLTTRGTIGNVAIYDEKVDFENIRINSGMLIFRPNQSLILSEYLFEVLRSNFIKKQINASVSGAAQPQLPIKTINNFKIPVHPSIEKQKFISNKIKKLSCECEELEGVYRRKLAALAELKQALLQKAFTGELTAADQPTKP